MNSTVCKQYTDSTNYGGITAIFKAVFLHSPQCNVVSTFKNLHLATIILG